MEEPIFADALVGSIEELTFLAVAEEDARLIVYPVDRPFLLWLLPWLGQLGRLFGEFLERYESGTRRDAKGGGVSRLRVSAREVVPPKRDHAAGEYVFLGSYQLPVAGHQYLLQVLCHLR